jgi:hypothetical protein
MTCIKTGCVVYLMPYGEWIYGDAFSHGAEMGDPENTGVLVVRSVFRTRDYADLAQFGNVRHFTVLGSFQWWDEDRTSMKQNSTLIVEPGMWTNHGYEGIPEELR